MHVLELTDNQPAGLHLRLLTFDRALPGYTIPGQYTVVQPDGHDKAFFALASVPGAPTQLLIKAQGHTAEHLCSLEPGARVPMSDAAGKGFVLPPGGPLPLVVLATGSGISAVRPLIEAEVDAGLPRPVHLLYGVYTLEHCSFPSRLTAWQEAGVAVHLVLSDPPEGWTGASGFVQQAAEALGLVRDDVLVVLCGFPDMVQHAKQRWQAAGLAPKRLLTNF